MNIFILILRLITVIVIAYYMGRLASKLKVPAIIGWLIAGMLFGPHAFNLVTNTLLEASWYKVTLNILETSLGLLIGRELVFNKLKKSGKQIILITLSQSLVTFLVVTIAFGTIFYFTDVPLYLAVIFGSIALATAPAPALSIIQEFKTAGPVTNALIPMAALDDIVAIIVFFSTISIITAKNIGNTIPLYKTLSIMILLPIVIGIVIGLLAGVFLKKDKSDKQTLAITIVFVLITTALGLLFNHIILSEPAINFLIVGMAFSATFANIVSSKRLKKIMNLFDPIISLAIIVVIMTLGAPLDYKLIMGAGVFTAIYIISRAIGKYSGVYMGAKITNLEKPVKKYLGLTLLPHSGVSLIFTGIAVTSLNAFDPSSALIIQATIAAAAVINEIIAVIISKKAFEWAGELNQSKKET